ncbi:MULTISPECIES: adhesin biosynthesis transcription regulatory family protein [Escherichia]|uniref:adhesin biosynthesis transcription regulatory family protein n=2 Tax=Enterobacteriaceae TaxID=543 RepID=UPI002892CEBD|nr:adhesin biosynthesis transcription regulatory family protein [Escherichia coli]
MMEDNRLYLSKKQSDNLKAGTVPEIQFWLLIEITPIHSERMILALKDFLVMGYSRREVCEQYNISSGYFSGALGRFQKVHLTVNQLIPYYLRSSRFMQIPQIPWEVSAKKTGS